MIDYRAKRRKQLEDLEKYEKRLKKTKGINRHLRRQLLAIAREEVEYGLFSKEELKNLEPTIASKSTTNNKPFDWNVKTRQPKGIINRKCIYKGL